jgi:uncharacterized protein YndB with AHSA1/START domain
MWLTILIVLAVVVGALAVVVSMQPVDFKLSRSTTIAAPPAAVFAEVNDLHRWNAWSPWAKMDPNMKMTFDGPAAGEGSSQSWTGNAKVGAGKMTITRSEAPSLVLLKLEFFKPFKATNQTEFTFKPEGQGTVVSWTMSGKNNFMAKAIHLVMNMDKVVGPQFEQGLTQLKATAESKK